MKTFFDSASGAVNSSQPNAVHTSNVQSPKRMFIQISPHCLCTLPVSPPIKATLSPRGNVLPGFLITHLKHNLLHLPLLEILVRLWSLLQRHRLAAQEGHLLLLLHEEFEGVFEDAPHGAAAEGHGDVFAVEEEAVDFPFFGAEMQRQ